MTEHSKEFLGYPLIEDRETYPYIEAPGRTKTILVDGIEVQIEHVGRTPKVTIRHKGQYEDEYVWDGLERFAFCNPLHSWKGERTRTILVVKKLVRRVKKNLKKEQQSASKLW